MKQMKSETMAIDLDMTVEIVSVRLNQALFAVEVALPLKIRV